MAKKRFCLFGLGYISDRHLQAIKDVEGELIAAYDPYDSVGKLDKYFPDCKYFKEAEVMDDFLTYNKFDYLVICTPNYLHHAQIKYGIRKGAKIICEKPITINYTQYEDIKEYDNIYPIMQLRLNKNVERLKNIIITRDYKKIEIEYITYRGDWYDKTWKMNTNKSGGIKYNIGIHIIDLMIYLLGLPRSHIVHSEDKYTIDLTLYYEFINVNIYLSIKESKGKRNYKKIKINNEEIDLLEGFDRAHSEVYKRIVNDEWIKLKDIDKTMKFIKEL